MIPQCLHTLWVKLHVDYYNGMPMHHWSDMVEVFG